jgi:hypothetical protein
MTKPRPWFQHHPAVFLMRRKKPIETNFYQRNDHADIFEPFDLFNDVLPELTRR